MRGKTTPQFIEEGNLTHNNFYSYPNAIYVAAKKRLKIQCPIHGEFQQSPDNHINSKRGCKKCGYIKGHNKLKYGVEKFIKQAKKAHNNNPLLNYDKVELDVLSDTVTITCKIHGDFPQKASDHLKPSGCPKCSREKAVDKIRIPLEEAIRRSKEAHGDKYDYSLLKYDKVTDIVQIGCPKHGFFPVALNTHYSGVECKDCSIERQTTNKFDDVEDFVRKANLAHNNFFDYSKVVYTDSTTNVVITCPDHGDFPQMPYNHIQEQGCSKCYSNVSKKETAVLDFISSHIEAEGTNRQFINNKEIDIVVPSKKLAIEFDGLYYHSEKFIDKKYHLEKTQECNKIGYSLVHIFEDEWDKKPEIVKSRLLNLIGKTSNKIFARKTVIKEVSSKDSREFLQRCHIQGNVNGIIRLGLYYEDKLVSLMTFGALRATLRQEKKEGSFELLRFCNELNTTVVGGASKLFKHFLNNYKTKEIISYADRRWSEGNLYEQLGFDFIADTVPNFFYTKGTFRESRYNFQKHTLKDQVEDKSKTATEIMKDKGYNRIFDCGSKKYKFTVQSSEL